MCKYNRLNEDPYGTNMKMLEMTGTGKRVLEVGCATGYLSELLKKNNCHVTGIEIDPEAAQSARKFCDAVLDIDISMKSSLPYEDEYFDVVLCGDVLEHTPNPSDTLRSLSRYIKKGGLCVVSVPNVAYWLMRLRLLFGNFSYDRGGILDEGHLRFFTLKTSLKMIKDSGLEVHSIDVTPGLPYYSIFHVRAINKLRYLTARTFKGLFAFQFLITAKRLL